MRWAFITCRDGRQCPSGWQGRQTSRKRGGNRGSRVVVGQDLFILEPGELSSEGAFHFFLNFRFFRLLLYSSSLIRICAVTTTSSQGRKRSSKAVTQSADKPAKNRVPESSNKPPPTDKRAESAPKARASSKKQEGKDVAPATGSETIVQGENEPYAFAHRRAPQTIP